MFFALIFWNGLWAFSVFELKFWISSINVFRNSSTISSSQTKSYLLKTKTTNLSKITSQLFRTCNMSFHQISST